jgi:WD40 repeat protein
LWGLQTGRELESVQAHRGAIRSLYFDKHKSMFITASSDMSAMLFDPDMLDGEWWDGTLTPTSTL